MCGDFCIILAGQSGDILYSPSSPDDLFGQHRKTRYTRIYQIQPGTALRTSNATVVKNKQRHVWPTKKLLNRILYLPPLHLSQEHCHTNTWTCIISLAIQSIPISRQRLSFSYFTQDTRKSIILSWKCFNLAVSTVYLPLIFGSLVCFWYSRFLSRSLTLSVWNHILIKRNFLVCLQCHFKIKLRSLAKWFKSRDGVINITRRRSRRRQAFNPKINSNKD